MVINDYICAEMGVAWSKDLCYAYVSDYLPTIYDELSEGATIDQACIDAGCTPNPSTSTGGGGALDEQKLLYVGQGREPAV